jgi:xanthine dehydrogenase accessory factor
MSKIYVVKDLLEKEEDFVVAKIVDTQGITPRKKGAWLLMTQDGTVYGTVGGGSMEAEVGKACLKILKTKESKIHHFQVACAGGEGIDPCQGSADVSIEYVDARKPDSFALVPDTETKAFIFGAGHVGTALEPILRSVNFTTTVIDDRPEFVNRERFPEAGAVVAAGSFEDAWRGLEPDENSYVVIVTRGHNGDYDVLKQALNRKVAYIGMMGSRKKVAEIFRVLREEGFRQEDLDRVYTPIGTNIFAETPEEIAISIAGEMIMVRAGHGER